MRASPTTESEIESQVQHTPTPLIRLVMQTSLIVCALVALALLPINTSAAAGLAVGGGLGLATLALYRALVMICVNPDRWRTRRFLLAGVWLVKWPALALLLYWALKHWGASPLWLCVGVTLVPAVVTAVAAWTALTPGWEQKVTLELR